MDLNEEKIKSQLVRTEEYTSVQIIEKVKNSSDLTWQIINQAVKILKPGVSESEATSEINNIFHDYSIDRIWHKTYVIFAEHTLLQFNQVAKQDLVLQEEDIAFIDLGIVKDGIEGDAGVNLSFGNNDEYNKLATTPEKIFKLARKFWIEHNPTGIDLYKYISNITKELGYVFNLDPAGHLIGAYPHLGWRKGLNTYPQMIGAGHWILEIQIKHPLLLYGGFYESLLI